MKVKVSRRAHFNAAHRLFREDWDQERNLAVFGKCSYPNYHGHNYEMIVSVRGEVDPETGFVMDMKILKELIQQHVEEYLDHRNLNLDIPEFRERNPTAENICLVVWGRLRPFIPSTKDLEVVLYETPRNFVTYDGH